GEANQTSGHTDPGSKFIMKLELCTVNQYVLSKQHLLEGHKAANVVQATKDLIGLHATDNTTPYLSLFARVRDFEREHLDRELYDSRSLARIECMRSTFFIIPKDVLPMVYQVYKGGLSREILKAWEMSFQEYQDISQRILEILSNNVMTISGIKSLLPNEIQRTLTRRSGKNIVRITNLKITVILLLQQRILISVKRRGSLKPGGLNCYARLSDWFPDVNLDGVTREEAMLQLVRLYTNSYGPVTERDISWWSGFRTSTIEDLLGILKTQLVRCKISGLKSECIMLDSDFERLRSFKTIPKKTVSFLPYEDPYVKGYADRERLIPSEMHDIVYSRGEALPSILLDGRIVGTWNVERQESMLKYRLFNLPSTTAFAEMFFSAVWTAAIAFIYRIAAMVGPEPFSESEKCSSDPSYSEGKKNELLLIAVRSVEVGSGLTVSQYRLA
nr:winged helix DNA-binding domain-containing protein [Candidatus Njordarchaeum guaymaensis]